MSYPAVYPAVYPSGTPVAQRPGWPQFVLEADVDLSGSWSADMSQWMRSGSVSRPASRQQGPLWSFQPGTASVALNNADGRFDPDNLAGPYVSGGETQLNAMVPVRVRAVWNGTAYPLFSGFADSWADAGGNYAGRYAETTLSATDGQKVLSGVTLPAVTTPVGVNETTGQRVGRALDGATWPAGQRTVSLGTVRVQATSLGDTAWNLMQAAADAEIGELYMDGSGNVVFRDRNGILTDTRSNTPQAVFGDSPGTVQAAGTELAYTSVSRARDDTTMANDIQATCAGGNLQEVQDAGSIAKYLYPRTFARSDLILTDDITTNDWASWVLYVSKDDEDRFDQLVISPLRDPESLWPQVLGRKLGDRIQVWRRPPGVTDPVVKDCFIKGIAHQWDWSAGTWQTTWTLQDASKYGSFFVLDDPVLGRLDNNALAF